MTFKPASRPGAYNQAIAPVDRTSKVKATNERDRNRQIAHNKKVADTHREYAKSFDFGIGVENQARSNALAFEDLVRREDQKFQMQAIQDAQQSAIRNADQKVAQVNRDTDQLVNMVHKTVGTGVGIYEAREKAITKQQGNDLQAIKIRTGISTEELNTVRKLELGLVRDAGYTDATIEALEAKGLSRADMASIIGTRTDVFDLSIVNSQRQELADLSWGMYGTGIPIPGFNGQTADDLRSDAAGTAAAYNHHVQLALQRWGNPNVAPLMQSIEKGRGAALGPAITLSNREAAARMEADATQRLANTLHAGSSSLERAQLVNQGFTLNPKGAYKDFKSMETLAGVRGSGVDAAFLKDLGDQQLLNKNGEPIGMTVRQKFGVQLDAVEDAYYENLRGEHSDRIAVQNQNALPIQADLLRLRQDDVDLDEETAKLMIDKIQGSNITDAKRKNLIQQVNALVPNTEGTTERSRDWHANLVQINPHYLGVTLEDLRRNSSSQKEYEDWESKMYKARGRDANRKTMKSEVTNALKIRLGLTDDQAIGHRGLHLAIDHAMADYDQRRLRLGSTMDQGTAHTQAYALFTDELGSPKDALDGKGTYGIVNLTGGPSDKAFVNPAFSPQSTADTSRYLYAEDLAKEIGKIKNVGERGKAGAALPSVEQAIDSGDLSNFFNEYGTWPKKVNKELQDQLTEFRKATGLPSVFDAAVVIANHRGLTIPEPKVDVDQKYHQMVDRWGAGPANEVRDGVPVRGYTSTFTEDPDGEQTGYDVVWNNPEITVPADYEFTYHTLGTDGLPSVGVQGTTDPTLGSRGRGFGEYGAYRYISPRDGKQYEVVLGHGAGPSYKGMKDGEIIPPGTVLQTMGGTGRWVGSHHTSIHVNGIGFTASYNELRGLIDDLGGNQPQPQQQPKPNKLDTPLTVPDSADTPAMNIEHELPDFPGFKVIESSTGEHIFNIKKPNGEWVQYPANLKNTELLRENYRDEWIAYNRAVNKGGIQR